MPLQNLNDYVWLSLFYHRTTTIFFNLKLILIRLISPFKAAILIFATLVLLRYSKKCNKILHYGRHSLNLNYYYMYISIQGNASKLREI